MLKQLVLILAVVVVLSGIATNVQIGENTENTDDVEAVNATEEQSTPVQIKPYDYVIMSGITDIAGQGVNSTVTESAEIISYCIIVNNTGTENITGVEVYETWHSVKEPRETIASDGILQAGEEWSYMGQYEVTNEDIISYDEAKGYLINDIRVLTDNAGSQKAALKVPVLYQQHNFTFPSKNYRELGADGHTITLENNCNAVNPTYQQLIDFVLADTTDSIAYEDGIFVCADYAERVHNNAEAAGIAAAWVGIDFDGDGASNHACNAFETVDRGTIYIDCTEGDKIVDLQENTIYSPVPIVDDGYIYEPMSKVISFEVTW